MYDSFIDIWEGNPMWGQHIEDWKTPEARNNDLHDHWIVELADNGWMDTICPRCHYNRNLDNHVITTYRY